MSASPTIDLLAEDACGGSGVVTRVNELQRSSGYTDESFAAGGCHVASY